LTEKQPQENLVEIVLITILVVGAMLLTLPVLAIGFAFYLGWFTLPHPAPDRERIKAPQRPV